MQRHILGLIALVLLAGATALWLLLPADYRQAEEFCWRLGAVLAVWWLAYPDLRRLPAWLLAGVPVLVLLLAKWPRLFLFLIPVVIVLAILKPRWGRKQ